MDSPGSVIDALGGTGKVAEELGLGAPTVSGWRERGIPASRWPSLVKLASDKGVVDVTFESLAALSNLESTAEARS